MHFLLAHGRNRLLNSIFTNDFEKLYYPLTGSDMIDLQPIHYLNHKAGVRDICAK